MRSFRGVANSRGMRADTRAVRVAQDARGVNEEVFLSRFERNSARLVGIEVFGNVQFEPVGLRFFEI